MVVVVVWSVQASERLRVSGWWVGWWCPRICCGEKDGASGESTSGVVVEVGVLGVGGCGGMPGDMAMIESETTAASAHSVLEVESEGGVPGGAAWSMAVVLAAGAMLRVNLRRLIMRSWAMRRARSWRGVVAGVVGVVAGGVGVGVACSWI